MCDEHHVGSRLQCGDWLIELHVHRIKWQSMCVACTHAYFTNFIFYNSRSETQPETIRCSNVEAFEACAVFTDLGRR